MTDKTERSAIERHAQTIIASLVLAAVIWVGKSLTDVTQSIAVMITRLDTLDRKIEQMETRFTGYVTVSELNAVRENLGLRIQLNENRIRNLEKPD